MPQIKIDCTYLEKDAIEAACLHDGVTTREIFNAAIAGIVLNRAKVDLTETVEDQAAAVAAFRRKANRIDTDRKTAKAEREANDARIAAAKVAQQIPTPEK